ncbi:MAG: hypothetical protein U1F77_00070 [Kiritimatiellia bacterium]
MPPPSRMSRPFGIAFLALGTFFLVQTVRMTLEERDRQGPLAAGLFSGEQAPRTHRDFQTVLYDASTWAFTRAELARVDDHVGEMSRVGFQPILPADVSRFVSNGDPLPANAVLVLFSGLDPAQFQQVHDLMARRKWPFAAAASLKHIASEALQVKMNQLAGPSWEMGLRLETPGAANDRDPWLSLDPKLYRSKFAHRAHPVSPLEMPPLVPVVFGGMDAAFSNACMAPGSLNCLSVRPGWIGRDLVGKLLAERGAAESASGRGGMGWFARTGTAGCDSSVLSLTTAAGGPPRKSPPPCPRKRAANALCSSSRTTPPASPCSSGRRKPRRPPACGSRPAGSSPAPCTRREPPNPPSPAASPRPRRARPAWKSSPATATGGSSSTAPPSPKPPSPCPAAGVAASSPSAWIPPRPAPPPSGSERPCARTSPKSSPRPPCAPPLPPHPPPGKRPNPPPNRPPPPPSPPTPPPSKPRTACAPRPSPPSPRA